MLSDLLETISKNPSGWTMQVGKETEMPITKESAAVLGIVIPVYPWHTIPLEHALGLVR